MHKRLSKSVLALTAGGMLLAACANAPLPSASVTQSRHTENSCMAEEERYSIAASQARATEAILAPVLQVFGNLFTDIARRITGGVVSTADIQRAIGELTTAIEEDQQRINDYQARFEEVTACRERRAMEINREAKRQQMDREEANARLATLKMAQEEDIRTARATNAEIDKRNKSYKDSIVQSRSQVREAGMSDADLMDAERQLQTNQSELVESERKVAAADARVEGTFTLSGQGKKVRYA
ncbi:MAG: hypothetical protein AAGC92_07995 [Pseudomonadota bacterium]